MQGKEMPKGLVHRAAGITPAYAGKSKREGGQERYQEDHPRICGEKDHRPNRPLRPAGSPPHMRGKGIQKRDGGVRVGITPAYAGKREVYFRAMHRPWDHPRICGEKSHERTHQAVNEGSPPHMRGKALLRERRHCVVGITPAYAGKREFTSGRCIALGDHPRICGEKQLDGLLCWVQLRITPAYAGKSFPISLTSVLWGDHPRICGEKRLTFLYWRLRLGSPPHMRGKGT